MKGYCVVFAQDLEELEQKVTEKLSEGFTVVPGFAVTRYEYEVRGYAEVCVTYYQPMIAWPSDADRGTTHE
jgi:hypothetical protein